MRPVKIDDGVTVVASVSGGKDSAALSLHLTESGIEHLRVFADTGWEHIRGPLQDKIGPITWVRGDLIMPDLIRKKGMFPGRLHRYCTTELKVRPIMAYLAALPGEVVNAVGIRAAESRARAGLPEWEWAEHFDCAVWRPLIAWSEADVIAIHTRHGLAPNPLYLRGHARVGCWPCIFARKSEIRRLGHDPERMALIREIERDVASASAARGNAANRPSLLLVPVRGTHTRRQAPIDEVVAWANTPDPPHYREPDEQPCVRWGLCETPEGDE